MTVRSLASSGSSLEPEIGFSEGCGWDRPRQFGAFRNEPGHLWLRRNAWWRTQSMSNASQQQNSLLTGK